MLTQNPIKELQFLVDILNRGRRLAAGGTRDCFAMQFVPEWRCRTSAWLLAYLSVNDPDVTGLSCTKGQTLTEVDHGANPVQIYL